MAPPADLRAWIALLEREGELVRVGAEVDRRLAAEDGPTCGMPGSRAGRGRRVTRPAADPEVLARGRGRLHHAPRRHYARPAHRHAQPRHVPDAEARPARDRDALADPQG